MGERAVAMSAPVSRWNLYLKLGRVSNLPTVWTNVVAGAALTGASLSVAQLVPLWLALSSCSDFGGMFLNDAFDRHIDARERPERPIPKGQIGAGEVFGVGYGLLGAATLLLAVASFGPGGVHSGAPVVSGVLFVGCDRALRRLA